MNDLVGVDSVKGDDASAKGMVGRLCKPSKRLSLREAEIVRLYLTGYSNGQIMSKLNTSAMTVNRVLNSEGGKQRIEEFHNARADFLKNARQKINDLTSLSMAIFEQVLTGKDENGNDLNVSLRDKIYVADQVLKEFSGLRAPTQIHTSTVTMSAEKIQEFRRMGMELLEKEFGEVIDIETVNNGESAAAVSIN